VTMIAFFWMTLYAPMALLPLANGKVWGMLWALTVGTWRWQALRQLPRAAAAPAPVLPQQPGLATPSSALPQQPRAAATPGQQSPRQQPPALPGLKAYQSVAVAVGVFLLVALLYSAAALYVVIHRHTLPHYP